MELSRLVDVGSLQGGPLPVITRVITPWQLHAVTHLSGDTGVTTQFITGSGPPCSDVYSTPVFCWMTLVSPNRKGPVPAERATDAVILLTN